MPIGVVTASLVLVAAIYGVGVVRLRRQQGSHIVGNGRAAAFFAGIVLLGLALSPPADAAAERLLSAHMAQHLVLWLAAPPLIISGRPLLVLMVALPETPRALLLAVQRRARPLMRIVSSPLSVWAISAVALWGWHLPRLYSSAVSDRLLHAAEHASFLLAALAFWSAVLPGAPRRVNQGPAILLVFGTMLQSAWLAMVIGLTDRLIYGVYDVHATTARALADQHLAGVLMWVPMTTVQAILIAVIFLRWFRQLDARTAREAAV